MDCSRLCAGGQEVGCTYIHVFQCPGVSCLSVHQALFISHGLGGTGTFGPLRWRPEEVQFPFEFGFAVGDGSPLISRLC